MAKRATQPAGPDGPQRLQGLLPAGNNWRERFKSAVDANGTSQAAFVEKAVAEWIATTEGEGAKDRKLAEISAKQDALQEQLEAVTATLKAFLEQMKAQNDLQMYINWGLLVGAIKPPSANDPQQTDEDEVAIRISRAGKAAVENILKQLANT